MIYPVYFWKKPDESRLYMSQCVPGPAQRARLRADGYKIYEGHVDIPDEPNEPATDGTLPVPTEEVHDVFVGQTVFLVRYQRTGKIVQSDPKVIVVEWPEPFQHEGTYQPKAFFDRVREGDIVLGEQT